MTRRIRQMGTQGDPSPGAAARTAVHDPDAATRLDVEEMVKEAFVTGGVGLRALREFAKETEHTAGALGGAGIVYPQWL